MILPLIPADNIAGRPVQVLILTYMRSGSSLTGDILQHSPGAFYLYEPFRALGHKSSDSFTIQYANGTIRYRHMKYIYRYIDMYHRIFLNGASATQQLQIICDLRMSAALSMML